MRINVNDILTSEVGTSRSFGISGEQPKLEDLELAGELTGSVQLIKLSDQLQLVGQAQTKLKASCHRCLRQFAYDVQIALDAQYSQWPVEGQWPIELQKMGDSEINLGPLIRQEIIISTPIKILCASDCLGLCAICGQLQQQPHSHSTSESRINRIRIKS